MIKHIKEMLSGRFQTLSTGRVLSAIFSLFALIVLSLVVRKILSISDPALLTAWNGTLNTLGAILMGLVGLLYSATKAASSLSELISAIRSKKGGE